MQISRGESFLDLWPLAVAALLLFLVIQWRRKRPPAYLFFAAVFGVYLLFALSTLFFPIRITGDSFGISQFLYSVNLIPFNFDFSFIPHIVIQQIAQNILLTVPFGFGISFVARVRAKDMRWLPVAVGVGVESMQLLIGILLHYAYRVIDINDAMLNALGVLIGYAAFRVFVWLFGKLTARMPSRHRGLMAYIDDVVSRSTSAMLPPA